jgi:2-polyprenyl-6-methoxyphenol hydroxylase-like FAD-dependent oxidoreductase
MMLLKQQQQCTRCPPAYLNDERPLIAIAGCGMSGIALALALQQRGMRAVIFEKDKTFDSRSQGYGLTIQQARACRRYVLRAVSHCECRACSP